MSTSFDVDEEEEDEENGGLAPGRERPGEESEATATCCMFVCCSPLDPHCCSPVFGFLLPLSVEIGFFISSALRLLLLLLLLLLLF